ncbi:hypothetical protein AB6D85_13685 [Vibrio splendidus]
MSTVNRYITNQQAYLADKKKQPLLGFTTSSGEQATWNDIAVIFTNNEGIKTNVIFNNANKPNASIRSTFTDHDRLDIDTHHLLFAYTLNVLKEQISVAKKTVKISTARKFLIVLNDNIASASIDEIQSALDNIIQIRYLSTFFNWLKTHKMIPASISPNLNRERNDNRVKTGDDAIAAESQKLPSEKSLLALGAIFYDVIPPYQNQDDKENTDSWANLIHSTKSQLNSYVCTMSALAMASPNRVAAEQVLLTKQRLQSHTEVVNGKESTVHYLNWRGSKGFKDYQNHINAEMAESLDRALHYTSIVTEPARVLARFYQNPHLSLKKVLGNFKPSINNLNALTPNPSKPTNLIHLGFLLGFFDDTDGYVRVTKDTKGTINLKYNIFIKHITRLTIFDKLEIRHKCIYTSSLVGVAVSSSKQEKKYFNGQREMTVAEFQNHIVAANLNSILGYNQGRTKRVDYDNALFSYTEKQVNRLQASHFLLVPTERLGSILERSITQRSSSHSTIFEEFDFSSDFSIKPHQFRHWQNNYLDKKGLPHLLITILSGRNSPEQTLTYIHTTDAQNASVISDILYEKETEEEVQDNVEKRIQSKDRYDEATDNLSPTFISEVGFCTQDLTLTPCSYMTEFETQCTLCSSSCHITHDEEAIELLKKDLAIQNYNLKQVQEAINFATSNGMQQWYQTHYRNTCMLKNLIEVLSDESIKESSIVRVLTHPNVMRITDLETKTVTEKILSLPDAEEALRAAIEAANKPTDDSAKTNFLSFLGTI